MRASPAEAGEERRRVVLVGSAVVAAALFVGLFGALLAIPARAVRARVAPVRLRIVESTLRPAAVDPPPAPRPPEREPRRAVRRAPRLADPTPALPESPAAAAAEPTVTEPVPLVAGLTLSSTTAAGRGPRFGVGNTELGTPGARAADPAVAASPPTAAGTARVEARLLDGAAPEYSSEARREGIEGVVVLALKIDASGHVEEARVVRGLGHGLDEPALQAARETRWAPATLAGTAVSSTRRFTVRFTLRS